jgi:hypothetical protein
VLIYKQHVFTKLFLNKQITHNGLQSVDLDKYGQLDTLRIEEFIYVCLCSFVVYVVLFSFSSNSLCPSSYIADEELYRWNLRI